MYDHLKIFFALINDLSACITQITGMFNNLDTHNCVISFTGSSIIIMSGDILFNSKNNLKGKIKLPNFLTFFHKEYGFQP